MATPNPAYSVQVRVDAPNTPGTLGRIATAVGEAGGNITALDIVDASGNRIIEDVSIDARDEAHADEVAATLGKFDDVQVISVLDRTFLLHAGGKIEVTSKIPLKDRADPASTRSPSASTSPRPTRSSRR